MNKVWKIFWKLKRDELLEVLKVGYMSLGFIVVIFSLLCITSAIVYMLFGSTEFIESGLPIVFVIIGFIELIVLPPIALFFWIRSNWRKAKRLARGRK